MEVKMDFLARCNISEHYSDIPDNVYFKVDWSIDFLKIKKNGPVMVFSYKEHEELYGKKPVANNI